jgi:hypothetical protein
VVSTLRPFPLAQIVALVGEVIAPFFRIHEGLPRPRGNAWAQLGRSSTSGLWRWIGGVR